MGLPPDLAQRLQAILESPTYRLADEDPDLPGDDLQRAQHLQLELLRPGRAFRDEGIDSTVVVFGSARVTDAETAEAWFVMLQRGVGENPGNATLRSEEHTSELQSLMRISYAVFCLKKKKHHTYQNTYNN